jgi:myo-inositol 2-dehydrogenase / D-chiro-inositol 1-dehydrogenase
MSLAGQQACSSGMEVALPVGPDPVPERADHGDRTPVRLVLAGCGAVTQTYYAQALDGLERAGTVDVVGIFDPNEKAMAVVRGMLPEAVAVPRFGDLLALGADAAIIASPPRFHADQAVEALAAGLHIFCEKPLATTTSDADRILAAASAKGLSAAIGLVRRQFLATRTIKDMLESGAIGRLRAVSCFEGGPFAWPVASPRYFGRIESGGGVLQDIGTHCLDLLNWWLGTPTDINYSDDAMGGIEANCLVRLRYDEIDVRVRLSRDWAQPNRYHFEGDRGWIAWTVGDTETVEVGFTGAAAVGTLSLRRTSGQAPTFLDCFAAQIACFVDSLRTHAPPPVPASAGRNVLALIEQCYASRRLMDMPWLSAAELAHAAASNETSQ